MGFGLMGAGAAVSGLMSGFQQGRKFTQDEILRDEQIKSFGLANKKAERENRLGEEEDQDVKESLEIVRSVYAPKAAAAQGQPDPYIEAPAGPGIAAPGAPAQPSLTDLQGMYSRLNAVGLRRILRTQGPAAAVQQGLEMSKRFSDARADAAIQALSSFNGTNSDQVSGALAQAGLPMPEGTRYERKQVEVIPGSGAKVDDVFAISPDGKTSTSLHQLLAKRMSPEEMVRQNTEIAKATAQVSHQAGMRDIALTEADVRAKRDAQNHKETMARINEQIQQTAKLYKLNHERSVWERHERNLQLVQQQFDRLVGYAPLSESDRMKIERDGEPGSLERAESRVAARSRSSAYLASAYAMNLDPVTLKPNASPAEVFTAFQVFAKAKPEDLVQQGGSYVVTVGKNKVLMPPLPGRDEPPAPATQGRAEAARSAGITPPPASLPAGLDPNTRYLREGFKGAWIYTPNPRGLTPAQWEAAGGANR